MLAELVGCMRSIVLANAVDKHSSAGCAEGIGPIHRVRAGVEVVRGGFLMGWQQWLNEQRLHASVPQQEPQP